ncbi:MAG: RNA methyltransferase, partial [Bacteroidota bacterium]
RISSIAPTLVKNDGILMYCTCTYNATENIDNVNWLSENYELESEALALEENWGIKVISKQDALGYQFYPHLVEGEGFFIACLRQKGINFSPKNKKNTAFKHLKKVPKKQLLNVAEFVNSEIDLSFYETEKGRIFAFPSSLIETFMQLAGHLKKSAFGTEIGAIKGKSLVPAHALALSHLIADEVPKLRLDKQKALEFLKKSPVDNDTDREGWHLVTYEDSALGWAKVLKNRINNYYPKEWRIRMKI